MKQFIHILASLLAVAALAGIVYRVSDSALGQHAKTAVLRVAGRSATVSDEARRTRQSAPRFATSQQENAPHQPTKMVSPPCIHSEAGETFGKAPAGRASAESTRGNGDSSGLEPEIGLPAAPNIPPGIQATNEFCDGRVSILRALEGQRVFPAAAHAPRPTGGVNARRGEFGADLGFLKKFHTGPQTPGENNHYIDLWSGDTLPALARANGLTNNNALFVDSHGKAGCGFWKNRYVFYPSSELSPPAQKPPQFSVRDLAAIIGPESAAKIHNIVIAGCNLDGVLNSGEIRKHFVNATNVTHTPAGQLGFKPMFYQAIFKNSDEIKTLYASKGKQRIGGVDYEIIDAPGTGATVLSPYVAELFLPGSKKPFRLSMAGRERLAPGDPATIAARARSVPPVGEP